MSLIDITKYFDRNSKKRDLSGNSKQEKGAKKLKEGSLNTSRGSDIPDEVFTCCVNILFSCIKNVEKQITQIFQNTKEMKEGQIKDEKQLAELMEAVNFISNKFDEYKKKQESRGCQRAYIVFLVRLLNRSST